MQSFIDMAIPSMRPMPPCQGVVPLLDQKEPWRLPASGPLPSISRR